MQPNEKEIKTNEKNKTFIKKKSFIKLSVEQEEYIPHNKITLEFVSNLLDTEEVRQLENFTDQGVKVSTHTYDVLKLSIDEIKRDYESFLDAKKRVEFFSLFVGIVMHDLSKGTIRKTDEKLSHSQMMLKKPEYIINETEKILTSIENNLNIKIKPKIRENIIHIVVSHHGQWGKIQPNTKEANIVHRADMYSAKFHRINPIGADKIVSMLVNGATIETISQKLDCTEGIIKNRLKRAKEQLNVRNTKQLMQYYKENKTIPIGDRHFIQRIKETDKLKKIVDKKGFKKIMLESPLLKYIIDEDIFEIADNDLAVENI